MSETPPTDATEDLLKGTTCQHEGIAEGWAVYSDGSSHPCCRAHAKSERGVSHGPCVYVPGSFDVVTDLARRLKEAEERVRKYRKVCDDPYWRETGNPASGWVEIPRWYLNRLLSVAGPRHPTPEAFLAESKKPRADESP